MKIKKSQILKIILSLYDNYLCLSDKCFFKFDVSDKMAKLSTCDIIHILKDDEFRLVVCILQIRYVFVFFLIFFFNVVTKEIR